MKYVEPVTQMKLHPANAKQTTSWHKIDIGSPRQKVPIRFQDFLESRLASWEKNILISAEVLNIADFLSLETAISMAKVQTSN